MPVTDTIRYSHKELIELMLVDSSIKEGFWGLAFSFEVKGTNIPHDQESNPAIFTEITGISLVRSTEEAPGAVDASQIKRKLKLVENN